MTLAIVYGFASLLLACACAACWWLMRRAAREGDAEAVVFKLLVATLATLFATGAALVLFVDAIGTIGLMVIGLAIAFTLVTLGNARTRRGYW